MKAINKLRKRKAVSPVIATVVLVAVTITIAVAVAYWMSGISSQYTKFEKVAIQSGVCTWDSTNGRWEITLNMKNTGTATATLIGCFINEIEVNAYTGLPTLGQATTDMTEQCMIESGDTATIKIYIDDEWKKVSAGTTVNIKIHSAGGMDYIKLIELV